MKIFKRVFKLTNNQLKFGSKSIGYNQPSYVIAEAGVNHNGDINLAIQLI